MTVMSAHIRLSTRTQLLQMLKGAIAKKYTEFYLDRQKITLKDAKNLLADDVTLKNAGVVEGGELFVKDLGLQMSWKTVFLVEYAGPLFIHPVIYYFPEIFYGGPVPHTFVMLHFAKRKLETLFMHRFSHVTMSFMNIFKNSAHYHLESGAAIWLFSEISNLITHIKFRTLRPAGSRKRAIPQGYSFDLVSFPSYFFKFFGWLVIASLTGSYAVMVRRLSWIFLVISTYQMYVWAIKKHRAYRKEFESEYPRDRKAMFAFIA
ncbi:3-oxo-5-alpha-steroid 4-dehydrogenase-domain-containing protein [Suillus lakei]|nr:3-oxo-5-alpha-steroid 4-dehydrogenase-domain-containing protein [Suillus lakei]